MELRNNEYMYYMRCCAKHTFWPRLVVKDHRS